MLPEAHAQAKWLGRPCFAAGGSQLALSPAPTASTLCPSPCVLCILDRLYNRRWAVHATLFAIFQTLAFPWIESRGAGGPCAPRRCTSRAGHYGWLFVRGAKTVAPALGTRFLLTPPARLPTQHCSRTQVQTPARASSMPSSHFGLFHLSSIHLVVAL
ncbi:hypothetical protein P153DRAFT_380662 [Dothidotthia symphoricarpi CBS 119687]|uniref:Uncharacterized protein n=1 Tax=Dothidotthia symphoricarpi CBS 119687 TaxID=1392245 RepID=A0A6A6AUG8_9PLEO|nr:uncharacterized protein P153DRAFT_380662 [Dothidotthia symphoricarpi CBS 119687]KAF2134848.1 hypothetical protein P153DRAFT_380662 [Dothidotthia symphoricarpi CBS 119687]